MNPLLFVWNVYKYLPYKTNMSHFAEKCNGFHSYPNIKAMFTLYRIVKRSFAESVPDRASVHTRAMFTLYRIGFCSVSKVALVQCEQELIFCFGAEIVPERSQCEQKPYPLYNLQHSLLI